VEGDGGSRRRYNFIANVANVLNSARKGLGVKLGVEGGGGGG
jgi:hypothetical protein